jgi:tetratricopeptide (TPR) repeat protein
MRHKHFPWRVIVVLAALAWAAIRPTPLHGAPQTPAGRVDRAALQDRLNRVRPVVLTGGDIQAAIRELHSILAADPRAAEGHLLLGLAYGQLGSREMLAEAVAEFRQALAIEPGLVAARVALARIYLDIGRPERAREEAQAALKAMPGRAEFLGLLGEAERQLGRPAQAVEIHRRALALEPAFDQARYYLSLALLDLKQSAPAMAELERLVQSGAGLPGVYFTLGSAYLDADRVDDALRTLDQGIRLGQARPDVRLLMARAYRLKGMLAQAETQLNQTLPAGAAMQASSFYQQLEADIEVERGLIRLQQGQVEPAGEAFRKAIGVKSDHGPAHQHLAEVYLRQGRHKEASDHAARAAKLGSPMPDDRRQAIEKALRR